MEAVFVTASLFPHGRHGMTVAATRRIQIAACTAVLVLTAGGALWWRAAQWPRRFATVVEGRLYRSGEVTPAQLNRIARNYGVKRVLSLLDAHAPVTTAEHAAATRLGIEWHNIPLPGDGASTPAERHRILELLADPNAPPMLVHCAAGTNRTGLAVGLYRLHCQHWPLEQVLAELRQFGFDDRPKHESLRQALAAEAAAAQDEPRD